GSTRTCLPLLSKSRQEWPSQRIRVDISGPLSSNRQRVSPGSVRAFKRPEATCTRQAVSGSSRKRVDVRSDDDYRSLVHVENPRATSGALRLIWELPARKGVSYVILDPVDRGGCAPLPGDRDLGGRVESTSGARRDALAHVGAVARDRLVGRHGFRRPIDLAAVAREDRASAWLGRSARRLARRVRRHEDRPARY